MRHPALKTLFAVDALGPMAVARSQGGIFWAHQYGDHQGILLFDRVEAAVAYQEGAAGYPFVVAEFGRGCVDLDVLIRVRDIIPGYQGEYRAWVSPEAIEFGDVRWHQYQQVRDTLGVPLTDHEITLGIIEGHRVQPDLPQGNVVITL